MVRNPPVDEIELRIDELQLSLCNSGTGEVDGSILIEWSSKIGFGQYSIYKKKDDGQWVGDSEYMDCDDDKSFITQILKLLVEDFLKNLHIEG